MSNNVSNDIHARKEPDWTKLNVSHTLAQTTNTKFTH